MKVVSKRNILFCTIVLAALLILSAADLLCGDIPFREMADESVRRDILAGVRIPRILTAILTGAALALSGTQMQAIFRNPLADPHIMGVSAGAGTGAAAATIVLSGTGIHMAAGSLTVAASAFAGAAATSLLIILISGKIRSGNTLLLFGVMLGFIFNAMTSIIAWSASEESLKIFYSWSAGSFSGNRTVEVQILALLFIVSLAISALNGKGLDLILFGDEYSELSGASVKRIRFMSMLSCCLATSAATAFCGPIGFVGIIAPHIARWATGSSAHLKILPGSALCGAAIAVLADLLSVIGGRPLPAGSTMAIIGIPVIFYILFGKNRT